MKKIILILVAVIAAVSMCSAKSYTTESRSYAVKSDYTEIEASQMVDIILVDGSKNEIRVEADSRLLPYVSIVVKGATLQIKHKGKEYEKLVHDGAFRFARTKVYVSARGVSKFIGSGIVRFDADDVVLKGDKLTVEMSGITKFEADRIECGTLGIELSGMSKFESGVKAGVCDIDASGQCKLEIDGTADELKIDASGMSKLSLGGLTAGNADIDVSGMSKADLTVKGPIGGEVSGMSKITCNTSADISKLSCDKSSSVKRR